MSVEFFADRDLGKQFPQLLIEAGLIVHRHGDHFAPNTPDTDWLAQVSANGWVAITHDQRIRYKPNELAAVIEHKAALLVVVGAVPFPDLAVSFAAMKDTIIDFVLQRERPFIAKVYRPTPSEVKKNPSALGRVEQWYP